jgi:hypothetical protein
MASPARIRKLCERSAAHALAGWARYLATVPANDRANAVAARAGKLAAGEVGVSMMTQIRVTSNAKAKRELGRRPHYESCARDSAPGSETCPIPAANRGAATLSYGERGPGPGIRSGPDQSRARS